eukprot:SAG31_NODE_4044_length_3641_cov_2.518916_1_plen_72_part_10
MQLQLQLIIRFFKIALCLLAGWLEPCHLNLGDVLNLVHQPSMQLIIYSCTRSTRKGERLGNEFAYLAITIHT